MSWPRRAARSLRDCSDRRRGRHSTIGHWHRRNRFRWQVQEELVNRAMCLQAGPVELTVGQQRIESGTGPGFIVEPTGCAHVLKNLTDASVNVLSVRVAMDVNAETQQGVHPKVGTFDEQALKWRDAIHGGSGQIATRHVLSPDDFYSDWTFLDHAILSAGGSVGFHYHDFLEESFVVLKGQGLMTIDDETFAVGPGVGDLARHWAGARHLQSRPGKAGVRPHRREASRRRVHYHRLARRFVGAQADLRKEYHGPSQHSTTHGRSGQQLPRGLRCDWTAKSSDRLCRPHGARKLALRASGARRIAAQGNGRAPAGASPRAGSDRSQRVGIRKSLDDHFGWNPYWPNWREPGGASSAIPSCTT